MAGTIVTIVGWILGLILAYLLFAHSSAVVSEFNALGGFATSESKILQGR